MSTTPSPDRSWQVDGVTFVHGYGQGSTAERFRIQKPRVLFDRYVDLGSRFNGGSIVELGIAAGGSTALLCLLAQPRSLIGFELDSAPVSALAEFITKRGLESIVRPFYGVDQVDRDGMMKIVDAHIGSEPVDLVIDDASHRYEETLVSFEVLFPRLRPGGWFIIEDWAADYAFVDRIEKAAAQPTAEGAELRLRLDAAVARGKAITRPLPQIGVELLQACGSSHDVVAEVTVNQHWIVVERGPADLDAHGFRLRDHAPDHWGWLTD